MSYAAICTSVRRNLAFLTQEQRAMFEPCMSERASLAIQAAAEQRGIRMPGVNHG